MLETDHLLTVSNQRSNPNTNFLTYHQLGCHGLCLSEKVPFLAQLDELAPLVELAQLEELDHVRTCWISREVKSHFDQHLSIDNEMEVEDHEGGHKAERTGGSDARVMPHGGAESDNIIILGFPTDPMLHTPSF
ncbi:hypothetical protein OUZ56_029183 [Daphnia magna]|uniref:Uncharacterized protein n=1 Tax=Daphnia magna TaxID=35525 RepID=A0ABR0B628_9CRUS|nr:hypothetical protein OUZ56_029183 [Daphnia magna]